MNPPAIEVVGLRHAFGDVDTLDDVTLAGPVGSFVSVVGPSGCGKSTLLRILAGLVVPDAGRATVGGTDAIGRPGLVGYMPQRDLLLPWKRALDNACLAADVRAPSRHDRARSRERAEGLFERFGLAGFERAWPSQLSGGMRQRLALLRTYLSDSSALLLDEPFGALDAITRRDLQRWLQDLWLDDSTDGLDAPRPSALLVTHDIDEALFLSDTVHVMSARPARIIDSITLDVPRPRPHTIATTPDLIAAKDRLLHALDAAR